MQMFNGRKSLTRQVRKLIRSNVNSSITFGLNSVTNLDELEQGLLTKSVQVTRGSAAAGHNRFFPVSHQFIVNVETIALNVTLLFRRPRKFGKFPTLVLSFFRPPMIYRIGRKSFTFPK
jgi:hypothetical protein